MLCGLHQLLSGYAAIISQLGLLVKTFAHQFKSIDISFFCEHNGPSSKAVHLADPSLAKLHRGHTDLPLVWPCWEYQSFLYQRLAFYSLHDASSARASPPGLLFLKVNLLGFFDRWPSNCIIRHSTIIGHPTSIFLVQHIVLKKINRLECPPDHHNLPDFYWLSTTMVLY